MAIVSALKLAQKVTISTKVVMLFLWGEQNRKLMVKQKINFS